MSVRFVWRGALLGMVAVVLVVAAVLLWTEREHQLMLTTPPEVPPHPTLTVPRGALPDGPAGLVEWTRYGTDGYRPVGRGFLFRLADGRVVGVTTAHSMSFSSQPALRTIALARGESSNPVIEFEELHGEPGNARTGEDMTVDYVLLHVPTDHAIDSRLILEPDPRGAPQPGERVTLYTLVNDQPRTFQGAVLSAEPMAIWVVMDDDFEPSGLSGSPFISQHTGKIVGMAIATTRRGGKVLLGLHPIGSLVEKATSAHTYPKIADFRR